MELKVARNYFTESGAFKNKHIDQCTWLVWSYGSYLNTKYLPPNDYFSKMQDF